MYSDDDFAMRLVAAFEAVLDPLVATLDNLAEHFDAAYAPRDVLELLTDWLGAGARRGSARARNGGAIVRRAPELMRLRGTRAGLELALELAFPGVPFRVEDAGAVTWSLDPDADREPRRRRRSSSTATRPCRRTRLAAVARLIDQAKPAHVAYRLRVRAPAPSQRDEGARHEGLPRLRAGEPGRRATSARAASTCAGSRPTSCERWPRPVAAARAVADRAETVDAADPAAPRDVDDPLATVAPGRRVRRGPRRAGSRGRSRRGAGDCLPHGAAALTLRLPDGDGAAGEHRRGRGRARARGPRSSG